MGNTNEMAYQRPKKKKHIGLIIFLVILALIVAGVLYLRHMTKKGLEALSNMAQTDVVSTRTLISSVGATGKVVSLEKKNVLCEVAGLKVTQVNVEVGDSVKEGEELLVFDISTLEKNLADAEKTLKNTQTANNISAGNAARTVADAQRGVEDTQRSVDYSNASAMQSIIDAETTVNIRKDAFNEAVSDRESAWDTLDEASTELETAKEAWQAVSSNDSLYYTYQVALTTYNTALSAYNATETTVESAMSAYNSAVAALESAKRAYDNTVATGSSSLAAAASTLASARSAQSSTWVAGDTTTLENNVDKIKEQIEKAKVVAPIGGIVTAVNIAEGDTYTSGVIVTIQDDASYEIETQISEYDISDIKVGQKVLIKTNATGDTQLEGKVIKIAPVATTYMSSTGTTTTGSDVTYTVRIAITTPNDRLRLDMSAALSIILEEHKDALTVPYTAVITEEDGSSYVEVVAEDGITTTRVPVEILMESNYYTEVKGAGLADGVTVKLAEDQDSQMQQLYDLIYGE